MISRKNKLEKFLCWIIFFVIVLLDAMKKLLNKRKGMII